MTVIRTNVTVEQYARLKDMAKAKGHSSISALFLSEAGAAPKQDEESQIVDSFLQAVKHHTPGVEFRIRDMFTKKEWEAFTVRARLKAGKIIMAYALADNAVYGFVKARKSSANHQYYKAV